MKENQFQKTSLADSLSLKKESKISKKDSMSLTKNTETKESLYDFLQKNGSSFHTTNDEIISFIETQEISNAYIEKEYAIEDTLDKPIESITTSSSDTPIFNETSFPEELSTNEQNLLNKPTTSSQEEKKSFTENIIEKVSNSEDIERVIGTTYKMAKSAILNQDESVLNQKKSRRKNGKSYPQKFTQQLCGIHSIRHGLILTSSGKYVKILEVLPIDYDTLSIAQKKKVTNAFASIFHNSQNYFHLKCIVDRSNPTGLINTIKNSCNEEFRKKGLHKNTIECAEDVIDKIRTLSEEDSLSYRYFICYEYEGKETDFADIWTEMETRKYSIISILNNAYHSVIDVASDKSTLEAGKILYYFFNKATLHEENLLQRIERINKDVALYNLSTGENKSVEDADFIAPKGAKFTHPKAILENGQYKLYFALTSKGHPLHAYPNWLSYFSSIGEGTEIDVHIKKLPHNLIEAALEQYTFIKGVNTKNLNHKPIKQQEKLSRIQNNSYIVQKMKRNEDYFEVLITVTLSSSTLRGLMVKRKLIEKTLTKDNFFTEFSDYQQMKFYRSSLPLTEYDEDLFKRNKRNYVTSSLKSLYMFSSYAFYDPNGTLLGLNASNNSIVSQDFFNTQIFSNANMAIFGGSGSGKTYTTSILARSFRLSGKRVSMICPIKAFEYKRGCDAIDGLYVVLGPGSSQRINIMAIMPADDIDTEVLGEDININTGSLLSQQITIITTWIQLLNQNRPLTSEELSLINTRLISIYERFGINDDNDSIWEDKENKTLKYMPIISDMYDDFSNYKELHDVCKSLEIFVYGSCKNMNGQTNIDTNNYFTVYDINESNIPKELLAPFLFIATILCFGKAKNTRLIKDVIIFEEIWKLLFNPVAAEIILDIAKTIRGYAGSLITITQNIFEYMKYPSSEGILSNCDSRFIMKLKEEEVKKIATLIGLNEQEMEEICTFQRGTGLFLAGGKRIRVDVKASPKEDREFTTDPEKIRKYLQEEKQKLSN